jgi:hypothetical protein
MNAVMAQITVIPMLCVSTLQAASLACVMMDIQEMGPVVQVAVISYFRLSS